MVCLQWPYVIRAILCNIHTSLSTPPYGVAPHIPPPIYRYVHTPIYPLYKPMYITPRWGGTRYRGSGGYRGVYRPPPTLYTNLTHTFICLSAMCIIGGKQMSDYIYEMKYSSCAVCGRFVEPVDGPAVMPVCDACFDAGRVDGWDDYSDHHAHG